MAVTETDLVVWLDPGLTTGMAWWDPRVEIFGSWQYEKGDLLKRIEYLVQTHEGQVGIGCEHYIIAGRSPGNPKPSLEVIGAVEAGAGEGRYCLLPPMPSAARKLGSAVLLRRLGWYKPGKDHANDAAMHLLAYLFREKRLPRHLVTKALHEVY